MLVLPFFFIFAFMISCGLVARDFILSKLARMKSFSFILNILTLALSRILCDLSLIAVFVSFWSLILPKLRSKVAMSLSNVWDCLSSTSAPSTVENTILCYSSRDLINGCDGVCLGRMMLMRSCSMDYLSRRFPVLLWQPVWGIRMKAIIPFPARLVFLAPL